MFYRVVGFCRTHPPTHTCCMAISWSGSFMAKRARALAARLKEGLCLDVRFEDYTLKGAITSMHASFPKFAGGDIPAQIPTRGPGIVPRRGVVNARRILETWIQSRLSRMHLCSKMYWPEEKAQWSLQENNGRKKIPCCTICVLSDA